MERRTGGIRISRGTLESLDRGQGCAGARGRGGAAELGVRGERGSDG